MNHVFVSYDHADAAYVARLTAGMRARRLEVLTDKDINRGGDWLAEIQQMVGDCAAFVPVMSHESERSSWVKNEVLEALKKEKPILPLLLEGEPIFGLGHLQCEDVRGHEMPGEKYFARLREIVGSASNEPRDDVERPLPSSWASPSSDVWSLPRGTVVELHQQVIDEIFDEARAELSKSSGRPLGVAIEGRTGSGKTYLLGRIRERIHREEHGYFLLVGPSGWDYWQELLHGVVGGLSRSTPDQSQLVAFLTRLTNQLELGRADQDRLCGGRPLNREVLDRFLDALRARTTTRDRHLHDTAVALVLCASSDYRTIDAGHQFLLSYDDDLGELADWGLHSAAREPRDVVQE